MTWPSVKLAEVATIEREGIDASDIVSDAEYLGLEHIESGGRILGAQKVKSGQLASTKFHFGQNHILYGKLRPYLAKIALPCFSGVCSTDILPIRPGPRIDRIFLAYFLRQPSMVEFAASRARGANLPRLSPTALGDFDVPLPPIDAQKRIAAILDQADSLRRLRQRAIDRLNSLGQAIFCEMFLRDGNGWPEQELSSLGQVITGATPPTENEEHFLGNIPFVTPGDLESADDVKRRVSELGALRSRVVEAGASLVCCIGATIGKIDRARARSAFNQQINAVQWSDAVDNEYGLFALRQLKPEIIRNGKGASTTLPILKKSAFQKLAIPVPPKTLQEQFSIRLGLARGAMVPLRSGYFHADRLFHALQHRAFRGEL